MLLRLITVIAVGIGCLASRGFAIDDSRSNREALITIVKAVSHPYSIKTARGMDSFKPNVLHAAKMLVRVHHQQDISPALQELSRDAFLMLATNEAANVAGYNAPSSTLLDMLTIAQGDGIPLTAGFFDVMSAFDLAEKVQRVRDEHSDYGIKELLQDLAIEEIAARALELGIRLKAEQMRGDVVARLIAVQREWSHTEDDQRFADLRWSVRGSDIHPQLRFTTKSDQNELVVALLLKNQARDVLNADANYNDLHQGGFLIYVPELKKGSVIQIGGMGIELPQYKYDRRFLVSLTSTSANDTLAFQDICDFTGTTSLPTFVSGKAGKYQTVQNFEFEVDGDATLQISSAATFPIVLRQNPQDSKHWRLYYPGKRNVPVLDFRLAEQSLSCRWCRLSKTQHMSAQSLKNSILSIWHGNKRISDIAFRRPLHVPAIPIQIADEQSQMLISNVDLPAISKRAMVVDRVVGTAFRTTIENQVPITISFHDYPHESDLPKLHAKLMARVQGADLLFTSQLSQAGNPISIERLETMQTKNNNTVQRTTNLIANAQAVIHNLARQRINRGGRNIAENQRILAHNQALAGQIRGVQKRIQGHQRRLASAQRNLQFTQRMSRVLQAFGERCQAQATLTMAVGSGEHDKLPILIAI